MTKLLASQVIVVLLQYGLLILMCFFLYRVIRIAYLDFYLIRQPLKQKEFATIAKLKVVNRGFLVGDQTEFLLSETFNIGRSVNNDIVINETTVSHEHACISYYQKRYLLSDLNSTNGILYNDMRLQQDTALRRGDKIQIGSTILQFEE